MAAESTKQRFIARCGRAPWRGAALIVLFSSVLASGASSARAAVPRSEPPTQVRIAPSRATGSVGYLPQIWQTYNNCGPASVAEVLAYWGITRTQYQVQLVLRADNSPSGMAPYGVPGYARSLGMRALVGVVGTPRLIKALVSNDFPVIVNQWYSVSDHTRHYRPVQSYDDRQGFFVTSDPYGGPDHAISYADFAAMWAVSDNRFIVLYPPSKTRLLNTVLTSAGWNSRQAYEHDLARSLARLHAQHGTAPANPTGGFWYYAYLTIAWDEMELGHDTAARRDLQTASAHGANPILVRWIANEIPTS